LFACVPGFCNGVCKALCGLVIHVGTYEKYAR
jgi:hypothetical protein